MRGRADYCAALPWCYTENPKKILDVTNGFRGTIEASIIDTGMPTDEQIRPLVERAQNGDREALAALFDLFYDAIYRFAYVRLGSVADAEEAAQETFMQMIRSIRKFKWQGSQFGAWLFRIARNVVAGEHRRRYRRREDLRDAVDRGQIVEGPEEAVVQQAGVEQMRALLEALPGEQRQVLELRFTSGLSSDEIGLVLGKSGGAVRIQQMRALQSLRERMEAAR